MSGIVAQNTNRHTGLVKAPSGGGVWNLILTQTASCDATITFDSDIDSTYDEYVFKFSNIHPETDNADFSVGFRDGSTAYDATKTTTAFRAYNSENAEGAALEYEAGRDLAQSTSAQPLTTSTGNDNDQSLSGWLTLFNPSSTTFIKHIISNINTSSGDDYSYNNLTAGYCNVTAAIDGVQFSMSSGDIDAGTISLYGIS